MAHLGGEHEQHQLERPHDAPVVLLRLGKGVEHVEEVVAVPREVLVQRPAPLQLLELVRVVVHPVPDGLLEGRHEGAVGVLLQVSEEREGHSKTRFMSSRVKSSRGVSEFKTLGIIKLSCHFTQIVMKTHRHGGQTLHSSSK